MKKVLTAAFAFLMVASIAAANGPGHGPGGSGDMGGMRGDMGGMRGDMGGGPGGNLTVSSNGTVFLTSSTYDSATSTSTTTIKAISASGTVLWTKTLTNARGHFELSGSNLLNVSETAATDGTVTSTITAISGATGATAWTKTVTGHVGSLTPFSGGTYAVVVVPASTTGGTATRSLIAISDSGATLWTLAL
jgi:hypothetical protein